MKVAIVSKSDSYGGGASRVAGDLHRYLGTIAGIESRHLAALSGHGFTSVEKAYGKRHKLVRRLHARARDRGFVDSIPFELLPMVEGRLASRFDLFHFHDLTTAFSPATLGYLARSKPVVWTFHDCSPFTGGCLHPMPGCERYKERCGDCPHLGVWPLDVAVDRTSFLLAQKRRLLRSGRVTAVSPSAWLAEKAWGSGSLLERPRVIPNPVDTEVFHPRDRVPIRRRLGLPVDRPVLLWSSGDLANVPKGAKVVAEVARALEELEPTLLLVGRYSLEAARIFEGLRTVFVGYLETEELAEAYAAADLSLYFSKHDNLPLVVLETMACGVPSVTYPTGGIPEMVIDGVTGDVVPTDDVAAAVRVVRERLATSSVRALGEAARARAMTEHAPAIFVRRHVELYEELLVRPPRG